MDGAPAAPVWVHDRYALFGEIASGGMATVHYGRLVTSAGFCRTVAIKRLHATYAKDPKFAAMFLDEAKMAGRVSHPNVVPMLEVVVAGGELFLVMEYVTGESLSRLMRAVVSKDLGVPQPIALAVIGGVLRGLHAAHEAKDERGQPMNLIHRDVSPQNVIVGADGLGRVLDFGIAKATGRSHETRDGRIKGKMAYMAPEQYEGHATRQSDIYAAGVVLWEVLTGERLFHEEEVGTVVKRVLQGDVPSPRSVDARISRDLEAIVMTALATRPERRFATAQEMASAIEDKGELALPSRVAAWVLEHAGAALASRAAEVARIESLPLVPPAPLAPSAEAAPAAIVAPGEAAPAAATLGVTKPRRTALVAAGAVLALLGAVLARGVPHRSPSEGATFAASPDAETAPPALSLAEPAPPEFSARAPATSSGPPPPPARAAPPRSRSTTSPAGKKRSSCDLPYTTGPDGVKHFRPECL